MGQTHTVWPGGRLEQRGAAALATIASTPSVGLMPRGTRGETERRATGDRSAGARYEGSG
eukprot:scaffold16258_cov141-Isochrysis_galbana.AAC.7